MMPISTFFWILVLVFCLIGAMRGWEKETLVSLSVVVALALRFIMITYVPYLTDYLKNSPPLNQFYIYTGLVIFMVFVGYAGPVLSGRLAPKGASRKAQDIFLGAVLGALNGYLIVGTIWYFLHGANYGLGGIQAPAAESSAAIFATKYLPPVWMNNPVSLFILVVLTIIFVLIVFL